MNTIQELRQYGIRYNIPIISQQTEDFLKDFIRKYQPQSIIEIGSAIWYSTLILSESLWSYHPYGEIISREISYPHYWQALLHTKYYPTTRIFLWNFCQYHHDTILRKKWYDMVFIDGRKSETLLYLKKLCPYIHNTTRIIIDDVIKFKEKMIDCYNFLDKNNIEYTIEKIDKDDGILIIPQSQHLIIALYAL